MFFVVMSDVGVLTAPFAASSLSDAAAQLKQFYGVGTGQVRLALLLPTVTGVLTQHPTDPAQATINMTGDSQNQQQIRNNLNTFLGVANPTAAQVTAAVRALARLAVADFTGTT